MQTLNKAFQGSSEVNGFEVHSIYHDIDQGCATWKRDGMSHPYRHSPCGRPMYT